MEYYEWKKPHNGGSLLLLLLCLFTSQEERVLFHYNGHGVPRATANGEIWVFNKVSTCTCTLYYTLSFSLVHTASIYKVHYSLSTIFSVG